MLGSGSLVRIPDAREMLGGAGISEESGTLAELAEDAGNRLERVVVALQG